MTPPLAYRLTRRRLLALATAAAGVFLSACTAAASDGTAVTEVSGEMPSLAGDALDGRALRPAAYAGRPIVVNFWATWCGPCRREQPALSAAQRSSGSDGPVFIGVNFRDDPAQARAYLREFDVRYPSVEDRSGSLAYEFDVPYLPATIFIDRSGEMRYRVVGAIDRPTLSSLIARIGGGGATPAAG